MNKETWHKVMACKKADNRHQGVANTLTEDEIATICATFEFFGAELTTMQQIYYDLTAPRYRVFDWLAMMVMGRTDDDTFSEAGTKVMVHSLLKCNGNIDQFINDLRVTDYDIDHSWESVEL